MKRSFINKLRDPDEYFELRLRMLASMVPLSFGIFFVVIGVVVMLVGTQAEAGTPLMQCLNIISSRILVYLALIFVLGSSIVLRILRIFVTGKLRKNKGARE